MSTRNAAVEITEDFVRYADGTVIRPHGDNKFCVEDIKKIIEAGDNPVGKESESDA